MKNDNSLVQYGTEYGGFYYPSGLPTLTNNSIIYCVGAGEDISHDVSLAKELDCKVHIIDPTPRAIKHVKMVKDCLDNKKPMSSLFNKRYGGGDPNYWKFIANSMCTSENLVMLPYALGTKNSIQEFYTPTNKEYVSHSLVAGMKSDKFIYVNVKTLLTIMEELDHKSIDLLKIDVEGIECDIIEDMVENNIFPTYISVDFDLGWTGEKLRDRERCFKIIALLEKCGYTILHEHNADYTFMRDTTKSGKGDLFYEN